MIASADLLHRVYPGGMPYADWQRMLGARHHAQLDGATCRPGPHDAACAPTCDNGCACGCDSIDACTVNTEWLREQRHAD